MNYKYVLKVSERELKKNRLKKNPARPKHINSNALQTHNESHTQMHTMRYTNTNSLTHTDTHQISRTTGS